MWEDIELSMGVWLLNYEGNCVKYIAYFVIFPESQYQI